MEVRYKRPEDLKFLRPIEKMNKRKEGYYVLLTRKDQIQRKTWPEKFSEGKRAAC
jgi:hypothetical protein